MKKILGYLIIILLMAQITKAAIIDTTHIYGLTLDAVDVLNKIDTSLARLCKKPTTRIVFDEFVAATYYQTPVNEISKYSFIMGEILDSYYISQYTLQQYTDRTTEYLNLLGSKVDIWEIGNEINGEWLGNTSDVVAKMNAAYSIIKAANKKTELTLYYNKDCWSDPANEMFRWAKTNVSTTMKNNLDYVLISYYEDDCNNLQPNWQQVFDSLHMMFPNSKIGFGECGTTTANKAAYISRYYKMNITTPNYVGGYFWWYFKQDCVPYTNSLWTTFNNAIATNAAPTVQASQINCTPIISNSISISWIKGNGGKRMLFIKDTVSGIPVISDGTTYTANTTYGLGTSDGTGWYCVYNGTGNSLTVSGLNPTHLYRAMVLEYNGLPGSEVYNKSTAGNNPKMLRVPVIKIKIENINLTGNNPSGNVTVGTPSKFELSQNFPNPFNPTTNISFGLPVDSKVTIKIYDISGRVIRTLLNDTKAAGYYTVMFDASGLSSGTYFYKIEADKFSEVKRMLLLK